MKDIIVVGGGCAGLTAAVYGARTGKEVLVIEGGVLGGQISYSPRVENYPSIAMMAGADFSEKLYEQALAQGAKLEFDQVTGISRKDKHYLVTTQTTTYETKAIILATGVNHRMLDIDGEKEMAGKGVSYCATCDGAFYRNLKVLIVGGGNTALLGVEYLSSICENVTLVHRRHGFRGEEALLKRIREKANVKIMTPYVVEKILGEDTVKGAVIKNKETAEEVTIDVDGIFVLAGQIPHNEIVKDLVKLDEEGYVEAGEDCRTSQPGIFVAGDNRKKEVRQLTTAAADGTVAALNAAAYIDENFN